MFLHSAYLNLPEINGKVYFAECGMRKFEMVYFADFHLRNVSHLRQVFLIGPLSKSVLITFDC